MIKNFLAYDLAIQLHRRLPAIAVKGHLKDQLERATESVALNLAEGSGKPTARDKRRFYAIAFGSIREVQAVLDLAPTHDESIIDLVDHLAAVLYKLVYRP